MTPALSLIVPSYDKERPPRELFERLYGALDRLGRTYEIVLVDAGTTGEDVAILAGFKLTRGGYVITVDADLRNPSDALARIVNALDQGADYVGAMRGCMFRGYARHVVDAVNRCKEVNAYVPALAHLFARRPIEIKFPREPRARRGSRGSFYGFIRWKLDLITAFSLAPLELCTVSGMVLSTASLLFVLFLAIRRLVHGPEAEGVFTLFGIAFFLMGVLLFGLGVVGEYVGRIHEQVRGRPRYVVDHVLQPKPDVDDELPASLRARRP
jgi:undecaprenyl-phosphate 4-deoxy-4-formamido-L-arabinose transferase